MKEIGFTISGTFFVDDSEEFTDESLREFVQDNIDLSSSGEFEIEEAIEL